MNIPYLVDATLSFTGELPPIEGVGVRDSTSGLGDIVVTGFVGWHKDQLHYNAGVSIVAPTSLDEPGAVDQILAEKGAVNAPLAVKVRKGTHICRALDRCFCLRCRNSCRSRHPTF